MPPAIKIENLSKQYRLGTVGTGTLSHDLKRWWTVNVLRREDPYLKIGETNDREHRGESDYVWALRDINLEVEEGEVLGIIGKNGAGKSTLLKILSKVTTPTTGSIKARGRIASLLEVGTGFHPEMTGRENIFMNGAIMGMTKAEIRRKFDEIVDFAGVERYIDTPVKRYSSGMTVRLGFAVAAHLEPEILVVDEVLAVGDAEFQKKAIGKMQDVSRNQGRTVLFVSHNMAAVSDLCNNGIILQNGIILDKGPVRKIINKYLENAAEITSNREWKDLNLAPGNQIIKIRKICTINKLGEPQAYLYTNEEIGIYVHYDILESTPFFTHGINLFDASGLHIFSSHDNNQFFKNEVLAIGSYKTVVWIPANLMQSGDYFLNFALMRYNPFEVIFEENDLIKIHIIDTNIESAKHEDCLLELPGIIRPKLDWNERVKLK